MVLRTRTVDPERKRPPTVFEVALLSTIVQLITWVLPPDPIQRAPPPPLPVEVLPWKMLLLTTTPLVEKISRAPARAAWFP